MCPTGCSPSASCLYCRAVADCFRLQDAFDIEDTEKKNRLDGNRCLPTDSWCWRKLLSDSTNHLLAEQLDIMSVGPGKRMFSCDQDNITPADKLANTRTYGYP